MLAHGILWRPKIAVSEIDRLLAYAVDP